jgi:hypothetical protein
MLPNRPIGEELKALGDNLTERRKVERINDLKAGGGLPGGEKSDYAKQADPVRCEVAGAPPPGIGGYRVLFVNRDEIKRRVLLVLGRNSLLAVCESRIYARVAATVKLRGDSFSGLPS